jgi:hypothetical protein
MNMPIFAFTTPRHSVSKESRFANKKRDYSMLKVYDDGKVIYRYYRKEDHHPEVQNRQLQLSKEEYSAFKTLYDASQDKFFSYATSNPVSKEGLSFRHTLIHAYGKVVLIPDYVIDPRSKVYVDRYVYFPKKDALPYYEAIRSLTELLRLDLLSHHILFLYCEHSDQDKNVLSSKTK